MDVNALYNVAKGFVNKVQNEKPALAAEPDAAICLILTDEEEIYSGITGTGVHNGSIVSYPAECVALIAMFASGTFRAKQMMIISVSDCSVLVPCVECLEMLMLLDTENDRCEIGISENKYAMVKELMGVDVPEDEEETDASSAAVDFFSGFGDDEEDDESGSPMFEGGFDESYSAPQHAPVKTNTAGNASLGAPAEFASGVSVDEDNPFYESPEESEAQDAAASAGNVGIISQTEPKESSDPAASQSKKLSKAELLKQAKKKKKVAKSNFNFFKKKS